MLNIRRVDHEASRTHCWRVTVQRRTRVYVRNFSDTRHGGSAKALLAAQVYRDQLVHTYPPLAMPVYCAILKKNNRSGVSGLLRVDRVEVYRGKRQQKLFWEAQWPIGDGRSRHRKFSILKYGEEGAYQMALAARETALHALSRKTFSPFEASCSCADQIKSEPVSSEGGSFCCR
jgi:hypothetical protein